MGRPLTLGSLQVYPSISLRDIGVDSNIYNGNVVVREDFTYTVAPSVLAELPLGDSHLVGTGGLGFVFFQQHKDQQSLNSAASGLFEVRDGPRPPLDLGGLLARPAAGRRRRRAGPQRVDQRARRRGRGRQRHHVLDDVGGARQDGVRARRAVPWQSR